MSQNDTIHTYLALGDSYTVGQSVHTDESYPVQAVKLLKPQNINFKAPEIIATTGWTTADLENAISNHQFAFPQYDIVTLLIGVNNQYQGRSQSEYKTQFRSLLQKAIELAGNIPSHVIVLSIPDYSVTPFAKNSDTALIAKEIDEFNRINKEVTLGHKVNYIDITHESRKASTRLTLLSHDQLHYSATEYAIWASMIASLIQRIYRKG